MIIKVDFSTYKNSFSIFLEPDTVFNITEFKEIFLKYSKIKLDMIDKQLYLKDSIFSVIVKGYFVEDIYRSLTHQFSYKYKYSEIVS